ncbi:MAG: hypothetical protein R2831_01015 [Chitinophagaceae bacterium]
MYKKRTVLLLGAGAVRDWDAPSTNDLTKLVRESGFYCKDNETRITEFIFQTLLKNGYDKNEINFETIINVIEELLIYYTHFDKDNGLSSLQKIFFCSKFEEELLNYSIEGGIEKDGYKLEIPKGNPYQFQFCALNKETPSQYFLQILIVNLLTEINGSINDYAYHTSEKNTEIFTDKKREVNDFLIKWFGNQLFNENVLRIYTLNYDRVFKLLALKSGVDEMFEGFESGEILKPGVVKKAEIQRIVTDFDCHCHYNLHGSIFWKIQTRDKNNLFNSELLLTPVPQFPCNLPEQPFIQIERGKSLLLTNIITGYQKAQRSFLPPFKQMHIAFDIDCLRADVLYIIGYSFGDEHINMSIKTTLKYNSNIKIHIIDPSYDERNGESGYELFKKVFINVFIFYLKFFDRKKISETCIEYCKGKVVVHTISAKEFFKNA